MKSRNISTNWQKVPFDVAYFFRLLMNTYENIENLFKNFIKTKLPGALFTQKFLGRFDENVYDPNDIPKTTGLIENEPVLCLFNDKIFFLDLKNETQTDIFLSHKEGFIKKTVEVFFITPLE